MITIYDKRNAAYVIRPCPFINITWNTNFTQDGQLGGKYDITLTGTLLSHAGSPIYPIDNSSDGDESGGGDGGGSSNINSAFGTSYSLADNRSQTTRDDRGLGSLLSKQVALRDLFATNCLKVEVASVETGMTEPVIVFFPKFVSINFAEGVWVDKCDYTITLEAEFLLDRNDKVIGSESYASKTFKPGSAGWSDLISPSTPEGNRLGIDVLLDKIGGFIEDFQESWSIEPEEGNGNTGAPGTEPITRVYRLTRNISAKGKDISKYECFGSNAPDYYRPHEQARRYVINHIHMSGVELNQYDDYPSAASTLSTYFASGLLNLDANIYRGYNHSRTENINITDGSYSVQDSWILSSGYAYENYNLSFSAGEQSVRNSVSIQGTVKGLTTIPGSGSTYGGTVQSTDNTAYENAINKYRAITNNGLFGLTAHVYQRANLAVGGGINLNPTPLTISTATNEFTGEINYTLEYDDRPSNLFSGVLSENISVSDTYPGDVFAIIPVLGRPTGPVLQYIGGRTEYQRSLTIELVLPPPAIGTAGNLESKFRNNLLNKPSLKEPTRTAIRDVVNAHSPVNDPGIRKYFAAPSQETWDPREGRYTLNVTWTYELNT